MHIKTIGIGIACTLLGVSIGRLLPQRTDDGSASNAAPARMESSVKARTRSSAWTLADSAMLDRRELKESTENSEQTPTDDAWVKVPSSLLRELSLASATRTMGQDLFGGDDRIEKMLQITDSEKATIQNAWQASRQKIRNLEIASMTTKDTDDESVRITVPNLSQATSALGNDFRSVIQQSMGENRSEIFLAVKQIDQMFSPPAGERVYTVAMEDTGDGGSRFHMTLEGPTGSPRVWVSTTIPDEIRHLTDNARIQPSVQE